MEAEITRVLGSRVDIGDLMAASDVMLFASRPNGMEGMPAVAIEAGDARPSFRRLRRSWPE